MGAAAYPPIILATPRQTDVSKHRLAVQPAGSFLPGRRVQLGELDDAQCVMDSRGSATTCSLGIQSVISLNRSFLTLWGVSRANRKEPNYFLFDHSETITSAHWAVHVKLR